MAKKKTPTTSAATEQKGKAGKSGKGKQFDPSKESLRALSAATPEINEPRPYHNRYPIPESLFNKMKAAAHKTKVPKGAATISNDKGRKRELPGKKKMPFAPAGGPVATALLPATNFAGISATGWWPPDCTMATGPNHVVLSVNSSVAVYKKTGGVVLLQSTLTAWFSNVIQGVTIFDPKLLFDQHTGRWVLLAAAASQPTSAYLLSVSATTDPLGTWRNYSLNATVDGSTATNNWADFPGLGVDANNLYITSNQYNFSGGFGDGAFQYAKIRVVPKAGPYSGKAAVFHDFVKMKNADNSPAFAIQPCHTFGAPQVEYLVNSLFAIAGSLTVWRITQSGAGFSLSRTSVETSTYTMPPNAPQQGNDVRLPTSDFRVLHAVFRGDSIWCALTTAYNWSGADFTLTASIHWFQIRAATPTLVQEGVFGAANVHSFLPACCPDSNGNLIIVFSRSGTNEFGSIYYTGRKATDPLGSLRPSARLKAGLANYVVPGRNRWGDYNAVCADPSNSSIWFYGEFAAAVNTWGTWVGSVSF